MSGEVEVSSVTIRRLRIGDIRCELFSMPDFLGFTGWRGLLGRFILFVSTIKPWLFLPCFLVGLPLVATNNENEVIGFAWLQMKKERKRLTAAVAGIGVKEEYRQQGIATRLMEELIA